MRRVKRVRRVDLVVIGVYESKGLRPPRLESTPSSSSHQRRRQETAKGTATEKSGHTHFVNSTCLVLEQDPQKKTQKREFGKQAGVDCTLVVPDVQVHF